MSTPTALITGASRGLGLALARALATQGWNLVLDARGREALLRAQHELSAQTEVIAIAGDIADEEHRSELIDAASRFGMLNALVNNASLLGPSPQPTLLDYPIDVLEQVYAVNVFAPLQLVQLARPLLRNDSCIINISSDAAVEAYTGWGGYGSSKAALEGWTRILAAENARWRVYVVDPGDMNTQMHQEAFPGEDISDRPPPEASVPGLLELLTSNLPSGRYAARSLNQDAAPLSRTQDETKEKQ